MPKWCAISCTTVIRTSSTSSSSVSHVVEQRAAEDEDPVRQVAAVACCPARSAPRRRTARAGRRARPRAARPRRARRRSDERGQLVGDAVERPVDQRVEPRVVHVDRHITIVSPWGKTCPYGAAHDACLPRAGAGRARVERRRPRRTRQLLRGVLRARRPPEHGRGPARRHRDDKATWAGTAFSVLECVGSDDAVALLWQATSTHVGPWGPVPSTGRPGRVVRRALLPRRATTASSPSPLTVRPVRGTRRSSSHRRPPGATRAAACTSKEPVETASS